MSVALLAAFVNLVYDHHDDEQNRGTAEDYGTQPIGPGTSVRRNRTVPFQRQLVVGQFDEFNFISAKDFEFARFADRVFVIGRTIADDDATDYKYTVSES